MNAVKLWTKACELAELLSVWPEEALRRIIEAQCILRDAPTLRVGIDHHHQWVAREDDPEGAWPRHADDGYHLARDLRLVGFVPEMEAAAEVADLAYLTQESVACRVQIVLRAASPTLVWAFVADHGKEGVDVPRLYDVQSDAANGWAFGYLQ